MTLVDTSIWVNHFRKDSPSLESLLQENRVLTHPWVIGELACGMLKNRTDILALLQALPQSQVAEYDEALAFLESQQLFGLGLGWVDVNLLASARLTGCELWTADIPLRNAAKKLLLSENLGSD